MATQANQTVHTGNTVLLMVANTIVGRAQGVNAQRGFGTEPIHEIGTIMPVEHVQNRYEGTVTLERYFMKKKTLVDLGFARLGEDILQQDVLDIVVVDKLTHEIIRAYRACTLMDHSETFPVNAIAGENATFAYLKASDSSN